MKKTILLLLALAVILTVFSACGEVDVSGDLTQTRTELTRAYSAMLKKNALAVTYILSGSVDSRKVYIEFGSSDAPSKVYGTESLLNGNDATLNTFVYMGDYWYLSDGSSKIAVSNANLRSSLWMTNVNFVDYADLLNCISPSVILADGFSADKFTVTRSSDLFTTVYTIRLNSSYYGKNQLFVNDFSERRTDELVGYSGEIVYYAGSDGVMREIEMNFSCSFRLLPEPVKVKVTLKQTQSVTSLTAEETNLYKVV